MSKTATYSLIASNTLGSSAANLTFSSIPATFTDLILVYNGRTTVNGVNLQIQFNGDTATNYSRTAISNYLTGIESTRQTSVDYYKGDPASGSDASTMSMGITQIFDYANTTTFKTMLTRAGLTSQGLDLTVGLWRKTPEAINSIYIFTSSGSFVAGSTFKLYGIQAGNA
jgi:hypothetical protein